MNNPLISLNHLRDGPDTQIAEGILRAQRLVSDRSGILSKVDFEELFPGEPQVFFSHSEPADVSAFCGMKALNYGDAASVDPDRAIMKAIGESVERYCSGHYDKEALLFSTYEELSGDAVDPRSFALFSARQYARAGFPFTPLTSQTPVRWARGFSLRDETPRHVPAAFVYVPYLFDKPKEPAFFNPISTGLACGTTLAAALYKSILEAIERDFFMIVWKNRLPMPRLDPWSSRDPFVQRLLNVLEPVPLRCEANYLALDMDVAVISVMLKTRLDVAPRTVMGIGADLDPDRALIQALEEAYLTFLGMNRYARLKDDFKPDPDFANITTPTLHALAHAVSPALRGTTDFLNSSKTRLSVPELKSEATGSRVADVKKLVRMLDARGLDVVSFDLTTEDIDDAGFKVVRSVIPGLQPLDNHHARRYLGGRRLYDVPVRCGFLPEPLKEEDLNPCPHPFP